MAAYPEVRKRLLEGRKFPNMCAVFKLSCASHGRALRSLIACQHELVSVYRHNAAISASISNSRSRPRTNGQLANYLSVHVSSRSPIITGSKLYHMAVPFPKMRDVRATQGVN